MMKTIFIFLFFIVTVFRQNESYRVSFVSKDGDIIYASNHHPVGIGDTVTREKKLLFVNKSAMLIVVNPRSGSFDVDWRGIPWVRGKNMIAEIKNLIHPSPSYKSFDIRTLDDISIDPIAYFDTHSTNRNLLVVDDEELPIMTNYQMDKDHFFFLQYNYKGKIITSTIRTRKQAIILGDVDFPVKELKYSICYQKNNLQSPTSEVMATFSPVVIAKSQIYAQIKVLSTCFNQQLASERENIILSQLNRVYGKVGSEALHSMMISNADE